MNKIKIWTKRGSDKIYEVIPKKFQKYLSNTILKHANVVSKLNKSPHDAYSIKTHVRTMTLTYISHEQKE